MSRVIGFIGTTPNIGTTACAFASAVRISERFSGTVLYLCLNFKSSKIHRYIGTDPPPATLDQLQVYLNSGTLTTQELARALYWPSKSRKLGVLHGNPLREHADFYRAEHLERLLDAAKQLAEVIIVDTNAYWDNPATLRMATQPEGMKVLVTTPHATHFVEDASAWQRTALSSDADYRAQWRSIIVRREHESSAFTRRMIEEEMEVKAMTDQRLRQEQLHAMASGTYMQWLETDRTGRGWMVGVAEHVLKSDPFFAGKTRMEQPWYKRWKR